MVWDIPDPGPCGRNLCLSVRFACCIPQGEEIGSHHSRPEGKGKCNAGIVKGINTGVPGHERSVDVLECGNLCVTAIILRKGG